MHTTLDAPRRARTRFAALGLTALVALSLSLAAATPALAHDELIDTSLQFNNSTGDLNAVAFLFNNDILELGTEILVIDTVGESAVAAAPEVSGRNVLQPLAAPLAADAYQVSWRVVSSDGHPIQGLFVFEVDEDGSAEIVSTGERDPRFDNATDTTDTADADAPADASSAGGEDTGTDASDSPKNDEITSQNEGSGSNFGAWIAIGVTLAAALGGGVAAKKQKQRKREQAAAANINTKEQN